MQYHRLKLIVSLFLILAAVGPYWELQNHDFVNYDDNLYVTENYHVQAGLTWKGIIWAFTTTHASNWHPVTWLSHMLDCEIWGLYPGGHHLSSLLFHIVNTLLLFVVLERMTGALWRSACVAAFFALHPLHVESVAWVAERKNVLSTFFWMITMWAYIRYIERPGFSRYLSVLLFFALGLMSKPMLVTLPFVLLLMDYWPLARLQIEQSRGAHIPQSRKFKPTGYQRAVVLRLIREKTPFFTLAAVSGVVTFLVQQRGGSVASLANLPIDVRIANAMVSYVSYIGKMIWPRRLAVFYSHEGILPMWQVAGAILFLVCVSVLVIRAARRCPYLTGGWLWYLGTLVPVIGLVQVGAQSMADRYTYVPLIGLFIIIVWSVAELAARWSYRRLVLATSTGIVLLTLMVCTLMQVSHWRNCISLFKHTLDVTGDNYVAHTSVGVALAGQGRLKKAVAHYSEALKIAPDLAITHNNLALALAELGRLEEAVTHFCQAVRIKPDYAEAHNNLGTVLHRLGRLEDAVAHYSEALRIEPDHTNARRNLSLAMGYGVNRQPRRGA